MAGIKRVLRRAVVPDDVLIAVSDYFGVERDRIRSSSRHREVVIARDMWVLVCRQLCHYSFPELQQFLGRHVLSHSTLISARDRAWERVTENTPLVMRSGTRPAHQAMKEIQAAAMWRTEGGAA